MWIPLNNGKPINTGGAPRDQIRLADINGKSLRCLSTILYPRHRSDQQDVNCVHNKGSLDGTILLQALADSLFLIGDGKADYLIVDPKTGGVSAYLNGGHNVTAPTGWTWLPQGPITGCMGDGAGVRFADIK